MAIYLGNLSVKQIEQRLGIELTEDERKQLNETHQDVASNVQKGKWHCFDIPFIVECGDMDTAIKIRDILTPYGSKMKRPIDIGIAEEETNE